MELITRISLAICNRRKGSSRPPGAGYDMRSDRAHV
jgi:hypothetical protein